MNDAIERKCRRKYSGKGINDYTVSERTEICESYNNGESVRTIARKYDVADGTIYNLLLREGVTIRSRASARRNFVKRHVEGHIEHSPTVSKSEVAFLATMEALLNVSGSRQVYINDKCFDWVDEKKKVIVEVDCIRWHSDDKDTEKNRLAEQFGYILIRVQCDSILSARTAFDTHRIELETVLL